MPMDFMQKAVKVGKIATGEKAKDKPSRKANSGRGRAESLTAKERKAIAKKAAKARWED